MTAFFPEVKFMPRHLRTPVPLFGWLQHLDRVEIPELYRTFNMGLGMVLVVRAGEAGDVMAALAGQNLPGVPPSNSESAESNTPTSLHVPQAPLLSHR